jgi:hypothetical protein
MREHSTHSTPEEQRQVEYREVPGFRDYRVGDDGSVWSRLNRKDVGPTKPDWRRMSPGFCRGYHLYGLRRGRRRFNRLAHTLVLSAFRGPRPPGMEACHNDGNRANNCLSNLRWDTRKANHADAIRHGTHPRGDAHGCAKLTESGARYILRATAQGCRQADLARELGVSESIVSRVVLRKTWAHVTA